MSPRAARATISGEVEKMRRLLVAGLLLTMLLLLSSQTGAAKPQPNQTKQTAKPIWTLAMDGPRVAYMRSDRRVGVWNLVTGATALMKGNYPGKGRTFGYGTGEVAIAGQRVALITRFVIGNSQQTQERLYTGRVGGSARQIGKLTNHSTSPPSCDVGESGSSSGNWVAGVVGSGKTLAVSTWKARDSLSTDERLSLVTPTGLRTIVTGPGAIVAQSASGGRIAVLRSTGAWPPAGEVGPATATPTVGVYSADGTLAGEIAVSIPVPDCYSPQTVIRIALGGDRLVVLTGRIPRAGSLTATVDVYDWTTGALVTTWPVALNHGSPGLDRIAVYGQLAALESPSKLSLLDLTTGKQVTIGRSSRIGCPPALGPRGLVYAVNPSYKGPGKLVFVPTARLLRLLGE
jgi:hypothetical protein